MVYMEDILYLEDGEIHGHGEVLDSVDSVVLDMVVLVYMVV